MYLGDGSTVQRWPSVEAWGTYDELWNANLPLVQEACSSNGWGADNSRIELNAIAENIQRVSSETDLDARFILANLMEGSQGCVRVPTFTVDEYRRSGLMQSYEGSASCVGVEPCSPTAIYLMIKEGTAGTSVGSDGLQPSYARTSRLLNDNGSRAYYAAVRLYNSNVVSFGDLNDGFGGSNCYAVNVANRLTGWTFADSTCDLDD